MSPRTLTSTVTLFLGLYLLSFLVGPVSANSLTKRARNWQCGQVKSNDKLYPNQCICFDALGTTAVAGQSTAQVTYANLNNFGYPQSTSNNGNCVVPDGGPVTLAPFSANKCCDFVCTFGLCGTSCLSFAGQACRSGIPVPLVGLLGRGMAGSKCPVGLTSCVAGQLNNRPIYECLDTQKNLESCGGCTMPDPRYGGNMTATGEFGRDCSEIPNAAEVGCEGGRCYVHSCVKGYRQVDNQRCIKRRKVSPGSTKLGHINARFGA